MKICAVILNYFGFADTAECVESLLSDDRLDQIVIVENSANEEERSKIEHALSDQERVRILCPGKNLGFAGGVNFALSSPGMAAFEAFLVLNNDTLIPAGTVNLLERGLLKGDFGFVAPAIYCYPETGLLWSNGNYYNRFTGLVSQRPLNFMPGSLNYLTGCCLLIHRRVFEAIGLFDETFFMYGEDVEFCHRATQQGLRYGLIHEARIFHKGSGSAEHNSLFYENHINRSHLLLSRSLAQTPKEAWISWGLKVVVMSFRAFRRTLRYRNLHALQGLRLAISGVLRRQRVSSEDVASGKA